MGKGNVMSWDGVPNKALHHVWMGNKKYMCTIMNGYMNERLFPKVWMEEGEAGMGAEA